jgi:hypothetical protein
MHDRFDVLNDAMIDLEPLGQQQRARLAKPSGYLRI